MNGKWQQYHLYRCLKLFDRYSSYSGRALPRPIRGLYLFCSRRSQPYTDAGFKAMWNRVQVKWAESGGERFTFHDIRAKALTDAKRLGLDAQALAGHTSSATTAHY